MNDKIGTLSQETQSPWLGSLIENDYTYHKQLSHNLGNDADVNLIAADPSLHAHSKRMELNITGMYLRQPTQESEKQINRG